MNKYWKRMKLIDVIQKTETINPQRNPDSSFEYIDVSSICNKQFIIQETSTILGKDAPSRARKFVRTGDILFATVRPTLKRIAQVPEYLDSQVCSTGYFVLRPKDFVEARFLFYFLFTKHFMGAMEQLQKGASYPAVNDSEVSSQTILIPPLSEQKRIVSIVDEAFEAIDIAIDNTKQNLTNARELFDSYLNAIFTEKGEEWITTTVEKLVNQLVLEKPLDGNHGEIHPKKSDFVKSGVPFIMASDLVNGTVDQINCNFITREQANSLRKGFAKDGDVLLSHKGTIGRAAILETAHCNMVLTPQVTYYRVIDKSVLHNRYLYYFFHSPSFQNEIKSIAKAGSTRAYIGITSQLQLKISYPKIDKQKYYADSFDSLIAETQHLEAIYRQKLAALNELKQSILHKAFTGELTADKADLMTNIEQEAIAV